MDRSVSQGKMQEKRGSHLDPPHRMRLQRDGSALWFYWLWRLSVLVSVLWLFGLEWQLIIPLGVVQLIHESILPAAGATLAARMGTFLLEATVAALFYPFYLWARKGRGWAFVVGMTLYALDMLIPIQRAGWWSVAFHLFALFGLYRGLKAQNWLDQNSSPAASR